MSSERGDRAAEQSHGDVQHGANSSLVNTASLMLCLGGASYSAAALHLCNLVSFKIFWLCGTWSPKPLHMVP